MDSLQRIDFPNEQMLNYIKLKMISTLLNEQMLNSRKLIIISLYLRDIIEALACWDIISDQNTLKA